MLEFGIYTLKQEYINKYSVVDPNIVGYGVKRPMICIKSNGHNILLPITSIDPNKTNYEKKSIRVYMQLKQEKLEPVKAMAVLPKFLGATINSNYQSVIYYSWAIPVKHSDVKKYKQNSIHCTLPKKYCQYIRQKALTYINEIWNGRYSGFMKVQAAKGIDVAPFQRKIKELKKALYENNIIKIQQQKFKKVSAQKKAEERIKRQTLKNEIAELPDFKAAVAFLINHNYSSEVAYNNAIVLYQIAQKKQVGKSKLEEHKKEKEQQPYKIKQQLQKQK